MVFTKCFIMKWKEFLKPNIWKIGFSIIVTILGIFYARYTVEHSHLGCLSQMCNGDYS